jgi:hypothetical protein
LRKAYSPATWPPINKHSIYELIREKEVQPQDLNTPQLLAGERFLLIALRTVFILQTTVTCFVTQLCESQLLSQFLKPREKATGGL